LRGVKPVVGDASVTDAYRGAVPADLILLCGVFGNISEVDIANTINHLPQLSAAHATVIWTRHRHPPDITPFIREKFDRAGFDELAFVVAEWIIRCAVQRDLEPVLGLWAAAGSPSSVTDSREGLLALLAADRHPRRRRTLEVVWACVDRQRTGPALAGLRECGRVDARRSLDACFRIKASASVDAARAPALDELQQRPAALRWLLLRP
jgi:hypothetical protein